VNNFGIYCCNDAKMNYYLWSEYDGQKTADEIISTLWIYFQKNQPIFKKNLLCGNITVVLKIFVGRF
jgi:hypothetical protein